MENVTRPNDISRTRKPPFQSADTLLTININIYAVYIYPKSKRKIL